MSQSDGEFDVLVCGGGAGGVGAALGAAQAGARVGLVERYGFLGGAATAAQVLAYCGFFHQGERPTVAVEGVGAQVLAALRGLGVEARPFHSETTGNWIVLLDPERVKRALDMLLAEHGVEVMLHARMIAAGRAGTRLAGLTIDGMDRRHALSATAFVDASGDGALSRAAGLEVVTGDGEGRIQAATMPMRIAGLAPGLKVQRAEMMRVVDLYNRDARYPVAREDAGIYTRIPGSGDLWWMVIDRHMPDLSPVSFTRAEQSARAMAHGLVALLRAEVAGFEAAHLVQTGPQIGVRESHHPVARYRLSGDDVTEGRLSPDGVARGAWPIELHRDAGKPLYRPVGGAGYFHIPLDACRAAGADNLWLGGRVIGADPLAYASIRVMGTGFASGQAAGVAAALQARGGTAPDAAQVQAELARQGALL